MSALPPPPLLRREATGPVEREDRPATRLDVEHCYQVFLGRSPEDRLLIDQHLQDRPSVWTLIRRVLASDEARYRAIYTASQSMQQIQDASAVNLAMSEKQRDDLTGHIEQVWARYGKEDAFFSVLTNPSYKANRITLGDIAHFYATGEADLRKLDALCRRNGVCLDPQWSICELGCGVARVGLACASAFAHYLGVDISSAHLAVAQERLDQNGLRNARLERLEPFLAGTDRYDLFYSEMVFQHNPPPIMAMLLDACLARVNPGGYAYFQLPCHLHDYRFEAASYLEGAGRKDVMEMHALPQGEVFSLLNRHGFVPLEVVPEGSIGPVGISYSFLAHKAAAADTPD